MTDMRRGASGDTPWWREPAGRRWLIGGGLALVVLGALGVWLVRPFWRISAQFARHPFVQPSRLYGQAQVLRTGDLYGPADFRRDLKDLGYYEAAPSEALRPGRFGQAGTQGAVFLRTFPAADVISSPGRIEIHWQGRRIDRLRWRGKEVASAALEPPLLASYYGDDFMERRPCRLDDIPKDLVHAVLAAEDDAFFRHGGVSTAGILRAAWVNLRHGAARQGGSTLTQQLVKNLYLSQERTLSRKLQEVVLALLIESRYDKPVILEAYLNEIYLGQNGAVNLIGMGAAAHAFFATDVKDLNLPEVALLAGMIRSPGEYSPLVHPERARERRNWVLGRMAELGWADRAQAETAKALPLGLAPLPIVARRAPYFADTAAEESQVRFGVHELADQGYALLSTVSAADQAKAEDAVAAGLKALETGPEKRHPGEGTLQAALVSIEPKSGALLAYVGGRDYRRSQFDRVGQAKRQAGSAFKPVVYAAAFEDGFAAPSTLLDDSPLTVTLAASVWTPRNDDNEFHGPISARTAVEESRNVPTARLALQAGLPRIVEVAHALGITARLDPVPALALGAFEVTPLELATAYAALANGGVRMPVHGLKAVLDRRGEPVPGAALAAPLAVLSPQTAYLLTSVLQGVLDRGTGAGVRAQGVSDQLAGKTGTTNGRRDSWFVGYAPNRASLVWVGYDDNSNTRLSGARAALPIWGRFVAAVRPPGGYPMFPQPRGIQTAVIDPESGELATERCPQVLTEVFLENHLPITLCHLHSGWFTQALQQPPAGEPIGPAPSVLRPEPIPLERGFRAWLRRMFGQKKQPAPVPPPGPAF